jgi:hypothetical protein
MVVRSGQLLRTENPEKMSCGNSKQELERAGVNALAICRAPYRNFDGIIIECGCPFSEHLNEAQPVQQGNYPIL